VLASRGTPHTYWSAGDEEARYLLIMTPKIAKLIDAIHRPGAEIATSSSRTTRRFWPGTDAALNARPASGYAKAPPRWHLPLPLAMCSCGGASFGNSS